MSQPGWHRGLKLPLTVGRNLTKTMDYLEVFARFKDEENIKAVERLLNSHTELEMFERSQLGMCPYRWIYAGC